jgi:hypothetical protein
MSKVIAISLKKQLEHVKQQYLLEHAQMQNEQQVQPTILKNHFLNQRAFN